MTAMMTAMPAQSYSPFFIFQMDKFFAKKQRIFNKSSFFGDDRKKNQIVDARIFDNLRRSFWADMATAAG